ncbi:MAG: hypothetical protein Q7R52_03090 [archaeon]|nr:hypothetical protein [archaeon]
MTVCEKCDKNLSKKVEEFSRKKFNKLYCYKCQGELNKTTKELCEIPLDKSEHDVHDLGPSFVGMVSNQTNFLMIGKPLNYEEWSKNFDLLLEFNLKKKKELGLKCH